jgi:hypothetical protein
MEIDELLSLIEALPEEFSGESLARKSWRFVSRNSFNSNSFNDARKVHHPFVFLNSAGIGYCDDQSATLAEIWRQQGYQARIWTLNGHVVPEVFLDGRWQMFDPGMGVFYMDENGNVAGMKDLQTHPEWIKNPVKTIYATDLLQSRLFSNSEFIAQVYGSIADNKVNRWYDTLPEIAEPEFVLPPKGQLRMALLKPGELDSLISVKDLTDLEIDFFAGSGPLKQSMSLLVADIRGNGRIKLRGKELTLEEVKKSLEQQDVYLDELEIVEPETLITVRCRISPYFAEMLPENRLKFSGRNLTGLTAEVQLLPEEKSEVRKERRAASKRFYYDYMQFLPLAEEMRRASGPEDIAANVGLLLSDQPEKVEEMVSKMNQLLEQPDSGKGMEIRELLKEPKIFIFIFCRAVFSAGIAG